MKRSEVIPAVVSVATPVVPLAYVVRNDRTEATRKTIEAKLVTAGEGYVLEIDPIAGASVAGIIKRGAFASDTAVIMRLRLNKQCAPSGVTLDTMVDDADRIICALLASSALDASIQESFLDELPRDDGLNTYQITFTVKTDTSAN